MATTFSLAHRPERLTAPDAASSSFSPVICLNERPDRLFTTELEKYRSLVSEGRGETTEASLKLRLHPRHYFRLAITPLPSDRPGNQATQAIQADGGVSMKKIRESAHGYILALLYISIPLGATRRHQMDSATAIKAHPTRNFIRKIDRCPTRIVLLLRTPNLTEIDRHLVHVIPRNDQQ